MKRWAVCVTKNDFTIRWEAIGIGLTADIQLAHLYTKKDLAEKKLKMYLSYVERNQWYVHAEIVEVEVNFPGNFV